MPRHPVEPPPAARAAPVTLAAAADLGLTRYELSSSRWHRMGPGVRAHGDLDITSPKVRIEALLQRLPDWVVLGGWASLWWQGVQALDGRCGPGAHTLRPILVHVGPRRHLRHGQGYVVDRSALSAEDVVKVRGVAVTRADRAVVDEMCRQGVEDGMVAGDLALLTHLTTRAELDAQVRRRPGGRGIPRARMAVPLLDPRVRSVPETRLRYVWVVLAGLPVPLVNRGIVDQDGWLLGEADLLDVEAALVGEYDGAEHRELRRHTADNVREEGFEGVNLTVARATSIDLWAERQRLVLRLRARHRQGLTRDRSADRFGVLRAA